MCHAENISVGVSFWWDKLETSHFEKLPVGIAEIDRVHKAAIDGTRVLNVQIFHARGHLCICCARDSESNVMQVADILRIGCRVIGTRGTDKERDQPSISRIKVEV